MLPDDLLPEIRSRVEFIRQIPLFHELEDPALIKIADRLEERDLLPEEIIFEQGDDGDNFYIIREGAVRITHLKEDVETELAFFEAKDTFGEEALLFDKPRSATVISDGETRLLFLNESNFDWILRTYPQIRPLLKVYARSHQIARRYQFDWLGDGEVIMFVRRRHPIRISVELSVIGFILMVVLTILVFISIFLGGVFEFLSSTTWALGALAGLIALAIGAWAVFEWRNDYFIVTNYRVIWRERILLRSSSLQEAPLRAIQSLNVQTRNFFERILQVGDVIVRTFNSELRMTDVYEPERMMDII
jgi:hypothetical protein